jgi:hypothetical protein
MQIKYFENHSQLKSCYSTILFKAHPHNMTLALNVQRLSLRFVCQYQAVILSCWEHKQTTTINKSHLVRQLANLQKVSLENQATGLLAQFSRIILICKRLTYGFADDLNKYLIVNA